MPQQGLPRGQEGNKLHVAQITGSANALVDCEDCKNWLPSQGWEIYRVKPLAYTPKTKKIGIMLGFAAAFFIISVGAMSYSYYKEWLASQVEEDQTKLKKSAVAPQKRSAAAGQGVPLPAVAPASAAAGSSAESTVPAAQYIGHN